MVQTSSFSLLIQKWYVENHRNLPWRDTKSPYKIWLSEIILQQTRVDQGMSYFHKFCTLFPTIDDLAKASEQEILTAWQGLGYYSRARNLHKTANYIVEIHGSKFPETYEGLLSLPGVGPYTAAAIGSFAFNIPNAVVDGNVYRVLSRYFDIESPTDSLSGKKEFAELAQSLIDKSNPAQHNQAIMEFGALVCTPKKADCQNCPLVSSCGAFSKQTVYNRPVKKRKTAVRSRYFHFILAEKEGKILIQQRTDKDIWQNMYQLPLLEYDNAETSPFDNSTFREPLCTYTHQLSHQKINASFWKVDKHLDLEAFQHTRWIDREELTDYPLPRLIDRFFSDYEY